MSGICGFIEPKGRQPDPDLLASMLRSLQFRGPDGDSTWLDGPVAFGRTYLRTSSCEADSLQPLSLDGEVAIVADARIDRRDQLLGELGRAGAQVETSAPDAELLLRAWLAWGDACLDRLIGDFSFVIWDKREQRLFAARDHFGVKPFFYSSVGGGFAFSNTLDTLRLHPLVTDELDDLWICDFLLFEMSLDPAATAFARVRRLPPGHCLSWRAGQDAEVRPYWQLPRGLELRYRDSGDYVSHFRQLLETAVADRSGTDRLGIDMSGGLDSSAIAATAVALRARSGAAQDIRAFTVIYEQLIPDREREFAAQVAEHLGIPVQFCAADAAGLYERTGAAREREPEPYHDLHPALGIRSMRAAAAHGRVVLTGWDGDALLNESPKPWLRTLLRQGRVLQAARIAIGHAWLERRILPLGLRDRLLRKPGPASAEPARFPDWIEPAIEARLGLRARWQDFHAPVPMAHPYRPQALQSLQFIRDLSSFFDFYDPGVHGLPIEYRHPLLDLRVVEFCLSLPPWPWCLRKQVLRKAMAGWLPEAVRLRPKAALAGLPYLALLQRPESEWVDEFVAFAPLNRYLIRGKIPPAWRSRDPDSWANLRPLTMDRWLRELKKFHT